MNRTVLVFLLNVVNERIEVCLGRKQTGHGIGKWNGFGGKIENGESSEEAAVREVEEESGVRIQVNDLKKIGDITYLESEGDWHVDVYQCKKWDGEIRDSKEMKHEWFLTDRIPYGEMWPNDRKWIPKVLSGEVFSVVFWHDDAGKLLDEKWES